MKRRNWFLTGLLLLVGAALLLRDGERRRVRELAESGTNAAPGQTAEPGLWERFTRLPSVLTGRPANPASPVRVAAEPSTAHVTSLGDDPQLPFRVSNTRKPAAELFRSETAVLLRNALVETRERVALNIPVHLRSQGDPGSWLVQARGTIDQQFRDLLRGAGAEIVSYVPNNTYLVRGNATLAQQLRVSPRVSSVLPFEPFYKLDMQLLPLAVRREAIPAGRWLNVVLFAGTQDRAKAELAALGAEVKAEQPFPFGHVVTIAPSAGSLVALAQLTAVQNIEAYHAPMLMNDLSRVRLDVSVDPTIAGAAGNWLGLTGNGITVAHIDGGIDYAHPQLTGRFFTNAASPAFDADGHGTFIAGVIVGTDSTTPTPTNGSIAGSTYRGMASRALLYPLSFFSTDYTNYGNTWLITNAALATNISIVNNSWGYPVSTYDINSALFDVSVRDALPHRTNNQSLTHVFAAGNFGGANSGGFGGSADTISSPGNAKNVITVGASEVFRLVPNSLISTNTGTNDPQANANSDSFSQVAAFSGRGNVGVGIEGTAGRFKPDLVAPGSYAVSLRASTYTNIQETDAQNMLGSSQWRYGSGTSVAAGNVSGVLALIQEFFSVNYGRTNGLKPSLNKALLINRARSLSLAYDFAVNNPVTHQGWGIPSLSNTVPTTAAFTFLTNNTAVANRIVLVDESAFVTNHVVSGQYHSYDVQVPALAGGTNVLKLTLAWTDPAGNPISSTKLVNDLDLYVTNIIANGAQFEGNNLAPGGVVSQPTSVGSVSQRDSVNNVENAFIPLTNTTVATTFRVYVVGRKVNVNAVSGNTNQTAQDYSLVISTDHATANVTVRTTLAAPGFAASTNRLINNVTNGIPYLNERVGANSPLWTINGTANVNTNGQTNQWNFYVFTNQNYSASTVTNLVTNIVAGVTNVTTNVVQLPTTNGGPFVAFATFLPPNLARARNAEADIDLFVARDGTARAVPNAFNLTNLDPAVLSHPFLERSTNRGGYELFSVTNSFLGEIFHVGIKSEDQQGGTYGFFGAASQFPFSGTNANNVYTNALFPVPIDIPDGSPDSPSGVTLYGIFTTNIVIQSVFMTNIFVHENLGDLVGTLTHNGTAITMNNHTIGQGLNVAGGLSTNILVYDDFLNPPDGPGDVTDLLGQDAVGLWIFEVYDNAPFQTGRLDYASLYIVPYTNAYNSANPNVTFRTFQLQAGQSFVDFLDVPSYATNLDVDIIGGLAGVAATPALDDAVDLLANAPGLGVPIVTTATGSPATNSNRTLDLDNGDAAVFPHLRISPVAVPNTAPLSPGRWRFRIVNNSASLLTLTLRYTLGVNLAFVDSQINFTNAAVALLDDYTTNFFLRAPLDRVIAGVDVGVAIQHPRIADLSIRLFSPSGKQALLFENRGGTNGVATADLRANFTENTNFVTHVDLNGAAVYGFTNLGYLLPIKFVPAPYSAVVSPPELVTNMTNLIFGHGSLPGSPKESPNAMAHQGLALFMGGQVNRNGTNDAFIVSYPTPILTNTNSFQTVLGAGGVPFQRQVSITNWHSTNFWPGSMSGYRGGDPAIAPASRIPERTFISGLAANPDGVFAVGQTRNYFPPATFTWSGTNSNHVYDIDLGSTAGSVSFTHITDAIRDHVRVEYQGLSLLDFMPAGVGPTNYVTNLLYNGASRFLRVTVNALPIVIPFGSSWTNSLTVYRSNGVTFAATNFVAGTFMLPPPTVPPYVAPTPLTLSAPLAVALDATNNVYVADSVNNRILKFGQSLSMANSFVPVAGVVGTNATYFPLTLTAAGHAVPRDGLVTPAGVAVNSNGDIYVADTGNNLIKRFRGDGAWVESWGDITTGTSGTEDSGVGGFARGRLSAPRGLSIATNGLVYVADTGNNLIRQIDPVSGAMTTVIIPAAFITTFGNLNGPQGIVAHHATNVLTANVSPISGNGSQFARFGSSFISSNNLYVADTLNNRIVWLQQSGPGVWTATQLAGDVTPTFAAGRVDNTNSLARFNLPSGITRDGVGNLYVTDAGSHLIRRVTPLGDVQTVAGDLAGGTFGNAHDDLGALGRFNLPRGLVADHFGTLFVADSVNNSVRLVTPYQSRTPTNAFLTIFPFTGPTNPVMGMPSVTFSRGLTNSVFGLEHAGADSRDYFSGVVTSPESGVNGTTNFLYAVGGAQFSTNSGAGLAAYDRMFITKFATDGRPIWTSGHMPAAVIHAVTNGLGAITSLVLDSGGSNYSAVPVVTILDPLNPVPANRAIGVTVTVVGGVVTLVPPTALAGPFIAPRVYVEAPTSAHMPGNGVAVAHGTNVVAAGYTNISTVPLTTNNLPFLLCLEATNGSSRWATNSINSGHYNSVAVYGDKVLAVGAAYPGGNTLNSSNLIEQWSLIGGTQTLSLITNFGVGRTSWISQVITIESLDRAYAVGSVINSDQTVHALLMEIDLQTLALVSVLTNNITNITFGALATNYGKAITTDGVDLYVAVEGPGEGNASDRQAAVFRYRAKNFYLAEESLDVFVGERTWSTNLFYTSVLGVPVTTTNTNSAWRLQITDSRAGGPVGPAQLISWSLNFSYAATNVTALALAAGVSNPVVLLSTAPKYFQVRAPAAAGIATNLVTATAPVRVTFHPSSLPLPGDPGTRQMFSGAATGSFLVSTNTNSVARLRPGSDYYIGIQALNPGPAVDVTVKVDFDRTEVVPVITALSDNTSINSFIPRTAALNLFQFNVPVGAGAAAFELLNLNGNVDLYLRRSNGPNSTPTTSAFDFRSANFGTVQEQVFVATNGAANSLQPGTWYLGVQNAGKAPVNFAVRATTTAYGVVNVANAQPVTAVTTPGNAPNTLFKLTVPGAPSALLFEARNLSGAGDLIVRRGGFPTAANATAAGSQLGALPELVPVRTNGALPNLGGDWYFGVLNPSTTHLTYTVMTRQPTNGVLLSSAPLQLVHPPGTGLLTGGTGFGFDLEAVPGEKYQVQYATNLASTNWLVLTNIVAPSDGVINFLHSGALSNKNLYYRIQAVP